jgi:hypothetical protein
MSDLDEVVSDDRYPGWRARLVYDEDAQPYGDALAPSLLAWRGQRAYFAGEVFIPAAHAEIVRAHGHYRDPDRFGRYLRIVHGVTTVVTVEHGDLTVWIFDTDDYRAHLGLHGPVDLSGDRAEWRAWSDSEAYGVIVEQRQTGTTRWDDGAIDEVERWREVDSLWGLFGHDHATGQARELLADHAA